MNITEHCKREDFDCRDGTLYPAEWIESRLVPLCRDLETIRAETGGPLYVLSGYRTSVYNQKVGGRPRSEHKEGLAGDLSSRKKTPKELYNIILRLIAEKKIKDGGLCVYHWGVHYDHGPIRRWEE